ncbi:MAG TPA: preprotein translocase subunit SecE [Planctomycetota bacterium]|nr:preprotein translocase subunit SecE [Planctomycetota bacterium]
MSDKVDQKDGKTAEKDVKKPETASAPPAPAGPKPPVWPKIVLGWIGLVGLSWGATLAHALSLTSWLGPATIHVHREKFSAGALGVGAAVMVALFIVVRKQLGARLAWQKPGQGKWVRTTALVALAGLVAFGCTAFYRLPPSTSSWWSDVMAELDVLAKTLTLRPILYPAAGIFTSVMLAVFLLLNQEKWAEFLIETEGELKKVSWPARKEYLGSAAVVVLVVAIISMFLFLVDHGMSFAFWKLKIGF